MKIFIKTKNPMGPS